jgi:hypothetical protein
MDYYLKANSEEHMWETLTAAGLTSEYEGKKYAKGISLDVIGVIYKETGNTTTVTDPEGTSYEVPETQAIEGYHANIRGELTEEQQQALPLIAKPATPNRIWFGD